MTFTNVEIKARTERANEIREFLKESKAEFKGVDEQTDTYFNVANGRLKLRQGRIENNLIYYNRPDQVGPKESTFDLLRLEQGNELRDLLSKAIGIKVVVRKTREIYYIGNVKFHLDWLEGHGNFVEIEAGNKIRPMEVDELYAQCDYYMKEFKIEKADLVDISYSDMLLNTVE